MEDEQVAERIGFIGETLGPLFLYDPLHEADAFEGYLKTFAALDPREAAREWPFVDAGQAHGALELMQRGAADACAANRGDGDDALLWEYRRLFVGPGTKPAPPWGSVYLDRECVVFGVSTLDLRDWMGSNGVERLTDQNDPEDHIGLMLLLMAWLSDNRPDLLEEYLRLHLLTWSSHFLKQLEDAAEHPFYQGLAQLTRLSLEGIQRELGIQVEHPRYYR